MHEKASILFLCGWCCIDLVVVGSSLRRGEREWIAWSVMTWFPWQMILISQPSGAAWSIWSAIPLPFPEINFLFQKMMEFIDESRITRDQVNKWSNEFGAWLAAPELNAYIINYLRLDLVVPSTSVVMLRIGIRSRIARAIISLSISTVSTLTFAAEHLSRNLWRSSLLLPVSWAM